MYAEAQQKQRGQVLGAGLAQGAYNLSAGSEPARLTPEIPREQQFLMQELSLLEKVTGELLEKLLPVRAVPRPVETRVSPSLPDCATEVGSGIRQANMHAAAMRERLEQLIEELAV